MELQENRGSWRPAHAALGAGAEFVRCRSRSGYSPLRARKAVAAMELPEE
jgi:hypothetical protein